VDKTSTQNNGKKGNMKRRLVSRGKTQFASLLIALCTSHSTLAGVMDTSDEQVREAIIEQSIASYPGRCPCPYSLARNGSKCGKRSAWSKAGGYAPICYPEDVTPIMIQQWRMAHPGSS
jgi:hypothetical protein